MRKLTRTLAALAMTAGIVGGTYGFLGSPFVPTADARLKDHPKLQAASDALVDARAYLRETPSDFRGHKDGALLAINEALRQVALAAGEHDKRAAIDVRPIPLDHVHHRLWVARDRIKEGREYLIESHSGFFGHKEEALKWIDETLHHLDRILVE